MNNNIFILDCTLRDGGYVNNWEFDTKTALSVRNALYDSGVRYIELGLMAKGGVPAKHTKFSSFSEIEPLLVNRKSDCQYAVMVTQTEYANEKPAVPPRSEKTPDLIRLAFFKPEQDEALETARFFKSQGYNVFLQVMATFMYSNDELLAFIDKVNILRPDGFYIVDSFSTMYNEDVKTMQSLVYSRLDSSILFGFHAHNNIQMAYSNAIEFLKNASLENRDAIIDGSIFGMGRGAGNVPIELCMEYLNKNTGANYDTKKILEVFEKNIEPIFKEMYWGYSMPYLLTATKNMNSVYAWYLGRKGVSSLMEFDSVLDKIPEDAKYTLMRDIADKAIGERKKTVVMSEQAKEIRKMLLQTSAKGHDGNLQSGFSSVEILWTLYDKVLGLTPENYTDENHNRFVLSKGQSTEALLEVLAKKGFIQKSELDTFCQYDSRLSMQADRTKLPMVEISAGSLGHGFPMAVGMAWANKIKKSDAKVYCLAGDGEMNEGTMWEAAIFAASENLSNLTLIIDDNNSIGRLVNMGDLSKKLEAFGFDTIEVNGHDEKELYVSLTGNHKKPLAVIAKTVRGYGSKTLMEDRSWFHRYPKEDELDMLLKEVDSFGVECTI